MSKKKPDLIMIVAVCAALALVAGAVVYAGMAARQGAGPSVSAGAESGPGAAVAVPAGLSACGGKDACIVVDSHCGLCCQYVAINAAQERAFSALFDESCAGYGGRTCDCFDLDAYPSCVGGACTLVKWPDEKNRKKRK